MNHTYGNIVIFGSSLHHVDLLDLHDERWPFLRLHEMFIFSSLAISITEVRRAGQSLCGPTVPAKDGFSASDGWMDFFGGGSTKKVFLHRDDLNSIGNELEMRYFFDFCFDLKKDVYPSSKFIDSSINLQTCFGDSPDFPVDPWDSLNGNNSRYTAVGDLRSMLKEASAVPLAWLRWLNRRVFLEWFKGISRWWFQTFFYFNPYLGKWSNLTNIFQMGWNHQHDIWEEKSWKIHGPICQKKSYCINFLEAPWFIVSGTLEHW